MGGMVEYLRALNSDCDGLLYRVVRVLISCIGIESPGVCIQRPDVLSRANLLLSKFQRFGRVGGASRIHQNEVESRLVGRSSGFACQLLELCISGLTVHGLSRSLLRSGQSIERVRIAIDLRGLHQ